MENNMHNNNINNTPDNSIYISDTLSVYENNMYLAVDDYILEHNNMDITNDLNQYMFKDLLYYIHDRCFPNTNIFKCNNQSHEYNSDLLLGIYNIYKRLLIFEKFLPI